MFVLLLILLFVALLFLFVLFSQGIKVTSLAFVGNLRCPAFTCRFYSLPAFLRIVQHSLVTSFFRLCARHLIVACICCLHLLTAFLHLLLALVVCVCWQLACAILVVQHFPRETCRIAELSCAIA